MVAELNHSANVQSLISIKGISIIIISVMETETEDKKSGSLIMTFPQNKHSVQNVLYF